MLLQPGSNPGRTLHALEPVLFVAEVSVPILVLVKIPPVVGPAVLDIAGWLHYVPACVVG